MAHVEGDIPLSCFECFYIRFSFSFFVLLSNIHKISLLALVSEFNF